MKMRDLPRQGELAFPPTWKERYTGAEMVLEDPLGGVLVSVEWGRQNLSLDLTVYWQGRRLAGALMLDDVTLLPRVYALLSAHISVHIDEIAELEIPDA